MDTITILNSCKDQKFLETAIDNLEDFERYLDFFRVSEDVINKIIERRINKNNIMKVLQGNVAKYSILVSNRIVLLKRNELYEVVDNMSLDDIKFYLKEFLVNEVILDAIYERRKEDARKIIKKMHINIVSLYLRTRQEGLSKIYFEEKYKRIHNATKYITDYDILNWIDRPNVPTNLKMEIFEKKYKYFEKAIKSTDITKIRLYYLCDDSCVPLVIQEKMIEIKKDELIEYLDEKTLYDNITYLHNSESLTNFYINEKVNENNIFDILTELLDRCLKEKIDYIIKLKKDLVISKIKNMSLEEFNKYKIDSQLKNSIIQAFPEMFKKIIINLSIEEKIKIIEDKNELKEIKNLVMHEVGSPNDIDYIDVLTKKHDKKLVYLNYKKVKEKLKKCTINFDIFMQYGCNSNRYSDWFNKIIEIEDIIEFNKIKDYMFKNFYNNSDKENNVYDINSFLELLDSYSNLYSLLKDLEKNNVILQESDKKTLKTLMNGNFKDNLPVNYEELKTYRYKKYLSLKEKINDLTPEESIEILNMIINTTTPVNVENLRMLKLDNKSSKAVTDKIDEVITYAKLIELITYNPHKIPEILKYIFESYDRMVRIQDAYLNYPEKIRELYEIEMNANLSDLTYFLNLDLSKTYSDSIINLSNKNYILCAHVLSYSEKVEDVVKGRADGEKNFISMSAISYKGQKYYYDLGYGDMVFAYNHIPKGAYICSSLTNMGSNSFLKKNCADVKEVERKQRGILETSAVNKQNSEILFYREGIKPCGIILVNGKNPTDKETKAHLEYNLPFIITQKQDESIENPEIFFKPNDVLIEYDDMTEINKIIEIIQKKVVNQIESDIYTGRNIGIFTDCHGMFEPLLAVLEDMRTRNIHEIYSLGDNVGLGPNPCDVLDLMEEYKVKSVSGNSEYYNTLGIEPFTYFTKEKIDNQNWTYEQLGESRIEKLKLYPASIDLVLGNKKIALCHFANDVRWDYGMHSTWTYQEDFKYGINSKQFLYTNSDESNNYLSRLSKNNAVISSINEPLFNGESVLFYDDIFQGHVHFEMEDRIENTNIYTLRACGMGWKFERDTACYYILKERKDGKFDIEKVTLPYNKNNLICSIKSCGLPHKDKILTFLK